MIWQAGQVCMSDDRRTVTWLLAIIAFVMTVAGIMLSYPVTMPLTVAVFVIAVVWPVKPWLDRFMPSWASYVATILVLLLATAAFATAVYISLAGVVRSMVERQDQFRALLDTYSTWARAHDFPVPGANGYGWVVAAAEALLASTYTVLAYLGSIAVLVVLGLPEVQALGRKLAANGAEEHHISALFARIAGSFRTYVAVTLITSVITGVASSVWALATGLDLWLTWGMLNFLLNFVPIVGNIIGILPPTLYAVVQFQDWTMPLVVLGGYTVLQIVISNFIEPLLQGQGLSLSPITIVVAVGFWGWVWGLAGALLAVPLTAVLVITCQHFNAARGLTMLLSNREPRRRRVRT